MSSVQYREGSKKIQNSYQIGKQKTRPCSGQCTCNFDERSSYDIMQFQYYVKNVKEIFPIVGKIPNWI